MKKTKGLITMVMVLLLLWTVKLHSQESPAFIAVTTMHWNMDYENFNMDSWKAVEKEFLDKIVSKNEFILASSVYLHHYTPDNRELVFVQAFKSWEDMGKFAARNQELAKEAWPDQAERDAFFEKRNAYYANYHSDEIYSTLPNVLPIAADNNKALITYLRKSQLAFPENGSQEEFLSMHKQYVNNVLAKNNLLAGYYPNAHAWGSDNREFIEAFFVNDMKDLDAMLDKNGELFRAHWDTDEKRKAFNEKMGKYFTGVHGDYVYSLVPELSKKM